MITNLQPLRALVHREGLVLFAANNYTTDPEQYQNYSIHLTNAAVAERTRNQRESNSMLLSELWKHLEEVYDINSHKIWNEIIDIMAKIVLSEECEQPLDLRIPGTCFDVIGVDVLLDNLFKPHVLECNNGPELYTLTEQVETRRANDQAHRTMLADLIPLVIIRNSVSREDMNNFHTKYAT